MLSFTYGFLIQAETGFYDLIFGSATPRLFDNETLVQRNELFLMKGMPVNLNYQLTLPTHDLRFFHVFGSVCGMNNSLYIQP